MPPIQISMRNIAPTDKHRTHHVYVFAIDRDDVRPFMFEESIGGGHAEQGGAIALRWLELEDWHGDWREHLRRAGCPDAVGAIESAKNEEEAVAAVLALRAVLERNQDLA
ncbi:hypothetical protein [Rhizobium binxianense]